MTDQKAPEGPQERLEGGPASLAPPEPLTGAQAGAGGLGLREVIAGAVWDANSIHPGTIADAVYTRLKPHLAPHYQRAIDAAIAAEQRAQQAETTLARYQAWLATQHANAVHADQVQGPVPNHLKISPHNGIAAGLKTALLGLDRHLHPHNAGPTVAECAAQDRAYWTDKRAGDQP
jgi:hypothetical protein